MKNKIIASLLIAILLTVMLSVLANIGVGQSLHLKLADYNFTRNEPSSEITIIAIDPKSTSDQGLGRYYNWSRKYYAQVLDQISKYKPKAIGIDLLFTTKSKGVSENDLADLYLTTKDATDFAHQVGEYIQEEHPDDKAFSQALQRAGNVIIAEYKVGEASQKSIPVLSGAAQGGLVNAMPDQDGIIRRLPLRDSMVSKLVDSPDMEELIINYAAAPYEYNRISFVDAFHGDFAEADIKDKVVIIGPTDLTLQDVHATPNAKITPMPGVEIQANAIQTILEGRYLKEQDKLVVMLGTLILIATFTFIFLNIPLGILALVVLAILYTVAARFAFERGTILNMFYPYIGLTLAYTTAMVYRYRTEFKEKRFVREAFGHYVSPEVVKLITKDPSKLKIGGERRVLSMMFTDIESFTTYSEKMAPEEIVGLINEYMEFMTDIVLRNGGTLDKYEGDAIMAFFGAPVAYEDHAFRACKTALEMRRGLSQLHARWKAEGKPLLNFRVGIATGEVLVGNMGSHDRFDYTVMGDTVNLAARLEPANKEYQTGLLVNEETARHCAGKFNFKALGEIKVKGKEQSVKVFTIA